MRLRVLTNECGMLLNKTLLDMIYRNRSAYLKAVGHIILLFLITSASRRFCIVAKARPPDNNSNMIDIVYLSISEFLLFSLLLRFVNSYLAHQLRLFIQKIAWSLQITLFQLQTM